MNRKLSRSLLDIVSLLVFFVVFIVPFIFILLTAAKTAPEAAQFSFTLPTDFQLFQNLREVIEFRDYRMLLALWNSTLLTVCSVALIVILGSSLAFVMERRKNRVSGVADLLLLSGLIIPAAVVPTIFVLEQIGLYRTLLGLIFVEVALNLPFATLLMRSFMATIPRELDEAAIIDGASSWQLFLRVILPLLRSAIVSVVVVSSVFIYNDFTLPLYFLPGSENVTAQLTLFSFMSQFTSSWNLLFADVVIITIPPLIMYIFFQRQIVAGMTSGGVKG